MASLDLAETVIVLAHSVHKSKICRFEGRIQWATTEATASIKCQDVSNRSFEFYTLGIIINCSKRLSCVGAILKK